MAVVLDHPEEALLLVGVLGDAVEEEGADTDSSLRHIINHLKSTMEIFNRLNVARTVLTALSFIP
jgi:hypothetical protein